MSADPLGDNLKAAVNSFDRLLQRIKDLHGVGQGHLAFFGKPVAWNHLRASVFDSKTLCGEVYDPLSQFTPESKGGRWCEDCRRKFKETGTGTL